MKNYPFEEIDFLLGKLINKYIGDEKTYWENYKTKDKFYKIRNDLVKLINTINNDQTEQLL